LHAGVLRPMQFDAIYAQAFQGLFWPVVADAGFNWVSTLDVAAAHTLAAFHDKAQGRWDGNSTRTEMECTACALTLVDGY
jgi:hypothetical protein